MRCSKALTMIDDHADGLLPADSAEAMRDHVEACAPCRDLVFAARASTASLAQWGDLDPPAGLFDAIVARIDAMPADEAARHAPRPVAPHVAPRGRLRRFVLPFGLTAAAAIIGAVAVSTVSPSADPRGHAEGPTVAMRSSTAAPLTERSDIARFAPLRPGEVYVGRDPDDLALRRTFRNDPTRRPEDGQAPVVPVRYDDFPTVR